MHICVSMYKCAYVCGVVCCVCVWLKITGALCAFEKSFIDYIYRHLHRYLFIYIYTHTNTHTHPQIKAHTPCAVLWFYQAKPSRKFKYKSGCVIICVCLCVAECIGFCAFVWLGYCICFVCAYVCTCVTACLFVSVLSIHPLCIVWA